MTKKLNPKQEKFCTEYLVDLNATQAAVRAGYSAKTAGQIGHELLKKPEITAHIQLLREELARKTAITPERVLQEYAKIGFFDIRKLFDETGNMKPLSELDPDTAACVAGIEVRAIGPKKSDDAPPDETELARVTKYKLADKKGALDSIARHLGMFAPVKVEHTGKDGKDLVPEGDKDVDAARRIAFVLAQAMARQGTVLSGVSGAVPAAPAVPPPAAPEEEDAPEDGEDEEYEEDLDDEEF